jgi:hypothetical protein
MTSSRKITKVLSANDVGDTGGHQAGMHIPKQPEILAFFPRLNRTEKNPRILLVFRENDGITRWEFAFIYYNNRFFGGTRNEYRLTGMTRYLNAKNAKVGDEVHLTRDTEGRLFISCQHRSHAQEPYDASVKDSGGPSEDNVLRLTGGWKVIPIR